MTDIRSEVLRDLPFLLMALTRSLIRAGAMRNPAPRQVLQRVHELFLKMNRAGAFATIFYGVVDMARHTPHYVRGPRRAPPLLPRQRHMPFPQKPGDVARVGGPGVGAKCTQLLRVTSQEAGEDHQAQ